MITSCFCGVEDDREFKFAGVTLLICNNCQTARIPESPENYQAFYRSGFYHSQHQRSIGKQAYSDQRRMEHDLMVAEKRLSQMGLLERGKQWKCLDVGCGNGSFVLALKRAGVDASGVDMTSDCLWDEVQDDVFLGSAEELTLPYRSLDVVTMFDSLEHMENPVEALKRIHRVLKRKTGLLIVEGPVFGNESFSINQDNQHHIRPDEHIWNMPVVGYSKLLEKAGFDTTKVEFPIPGRVRLYAVDSMETIDLKIGLPAGIGDVHWVMLKMDAIKAANDPCEITFYVNEHTPARVAPMLELLPWTKEVRYHTWLHHPHMNSEVIWNPIASEVDFGIILNDALEHGKRIETLLPEYEVNWNYPVLLQPDDRQDAENLQRDINPLVIIYLCSMATNRLWGDEDWNIGKWLEVINGIYAITKKRLVLVGSSFEMFRDEWRDDLGVYEELKRLDPNIDNKVYNLIGQTTVPEVLAMINEADLVVGMPSGMTIMAAHFRRPTVTIWPAISISKSKEVFYHDFKDCWVDPSFLETGKWKAFTFGVAEPKDLIEYSTVLLKGRHS